jgi:hypothetical protein
MPIEFQWGNTTLKKVNGNRYATTLLGSGVPGMAYQIFFRIFSKKKTKKQKQKQKQTKTKQKKTMIVMLIICLFCMCVDGPWPDPCSPRR